LYWVGFWMMVTIRSSSSEVSSPALHEEVQSQPAFSQSGFVPLRILLAPASAPFPVLSILFSPCCSIHARGWREECVPLVQVDIGLLAHKVGVSATDTLDLGEGVHNLLLSIDVGVQETQDLFEGGNSRSARVVSSLLFLSPHRRAGPSRSTRRARRGAGDGWQHLRTGSSTSLPTRATCWATFSWRAARGCRGWCWRVRRAKFSRGGRDALCGSLNFGREPSVVGRLGHIGGHGCHVIHHAFAGLPAEGKLCQPIDIRHLARAVSPN
jgi:hypothetical protein